MSPKERDDNQDATAAERDASTSDAVEPLGETEKQDVTAPEGARQPEQPEVQERPAARARKLTPTRASGMWAGLIVAAIVLIFLLVFILQNLDEVEIEFLMFSGRLPIGVALLLAAVAGILMVAIPGMARMIQLRRYAKR